VVLNYHDNASSPREGTSSFSFPFHSHNEETGARRDGVCYGVVGRHFVTWPLACQMRVYKYLLSFFMP
jgi:hypothetical protein